VIDGINDTRQDAEQLLKFTARIPCKINLIPCNSADPGYPPAPPERVNWFREYLDTHQRTVTIRSRKGWEIQAACGQLYTANTARLGAKINISSKLH
jgi:23S rRNA (adenine2503-C2)-methyltransferase